MKLRYLMTAALLSLLPVEAMATVRYVTTTGSDVAAGTSVAPYATIPKCLSVSAPGDTCNISPGTYDGGYLTTVNGSNGSPITVQCATTADVYVRGACKIVPAANSTTNSAWQLGNAPSTGDYIIVKGFNIDGSSYRSGTIWKFGLFAYGNADQLLENIIHNFGANVSCASGGGSGLQADGFYGGANVVISRNVLHDVGPTTCNTFQGIYISGVGALVSNNVVYGISASAINQWHNADASIIVNNTVFNSNGGITMGVGEWDGTAGAPGATINTNATTATGNPVLHFASTTGVVDGWGIWNDSGGGISYTAKVLSHTSTTVTMDQNAVAPGVASGAIMNFGPQSHNNVVNNNIIVFNTAGSGATGLSEFGNQAQMTYNNNLIFGNSTDTNLRAGGTLASTVTTDPLFVNGVRTGHGDYHLGAGSPAIGAGTSTNAPGDDFDNVTRPQGGTYDIGAYEKVPNSPYFTMSSGTVAADAAGIGATLTLRGYQKGIDDSGACVNLQNSLPSTPGAQKSLCINNAGTLVFRNAAGATIMQLADSGTLSVGPAGDNHGLQGAFCVSTLSFPATSSSGTMQTCRYKLGNTASAATAVRLTADAATAGTTNCINLPDNTSATYSGQLIASDVTTRGKDYSWSLPNGFFKRDTAASTVTLTNGTPVTATRGTVTGAAVALTADTTLGCFNLSFTPPTSNTDVWNIAAYIDTIENGP